MLPRDLTAGAMLVALILYGISGGADFGAGVWELFLSKDASPEQRELIANAIKPIWEADHVWLILLVVILFSAFPPAFSFICITLNVPLALMLLGIVFRGTAFTFRSHEHDSEQRTTMWTHMFTTSSLITPIFLGAVAAAMSAGNLRIEPTIGVQDMFLPWLTSYCISAGLFTLSMFALLAAVYLTVDAAGHPEIQAIFRKRAFIAHGVMLVLGVATLVCANNDAKPFLQAFYNHAGFIAVIGAFIVAAILLFLLLYQKRYKLARIVAAAEVSLVIIGYALAQFPYIVRPGLTIANCATANATMELLLAALAIGAVTLFPSLFLLFRIFKGTGRHSTTGAPLSF